MGGVSSGQYRRLSKLSGWQGALSASPPRGRGRRYARMPTVSIVDLMGIRVSMEIRQARGKHRRPRRSLHDWWAGSAVGQWLVAG